MSTRFWDAQISSTGQYIINYETGDGITCPKDLAQITLDVLPKITIDTILGHSLQGCDYVILPPITGKIQQLELPILVAHLAQKRNTILETLFAKVCGCLFMEMTLHFAVTTPTSSLL